MVTTPVKTKKTTQNEKDTEPLVSLRVQREEEGVVVTVATSKPFQDAMRKFIAQMEDVDKVGTLDSDSWPGEYLAPINEDGGGLAYLSNEFVFRGATRPVTLKAVGKTFHRSDYINLSFLRLATEDPVTIVFSERPVDNTIMKTALPTTVSEVARQIYAQWGGSVEVDINIYEK